MAQVLRLRTNLLAASAWGEIFCHPQKWLAGF